MSLKGLLVNKEHPEEGNVRVTGECLAMRTPFCVPHDITELINSARNFQNIRNYLAFISADGLTRY